MKTRVRPLFSRVLVRLGATRKKGKKSAIRFCVQKEGRTGARPRKRKGGLICMELAVQEGKRKMGMRWTKGLDKSASR